MSEQQFKTFQYRLYPTKAQKKRLEATLETCRRWYNTCLAERRNAYQERGETIRKFDQTRQINILKATNPHAATVCNQTFQVVIDDLEKAFRAFFRRVKAGEKAGYPRFKSKNRFHSFGFAQYGNGVKIDGRRLRLFGIGRVSVRWHRPIEGKSRRSVSCARPASGTPALPVRWSRSPSPRSGAKSESMWGLPA